MWEVFTCGQMPYDQMRNAEVVDFVCTHNKRLAKPQASTDNIYHIMEKCWDKVNALFFLIDSSYSNILHCKSVEFEKLFFCIRS